MIKTGLWVKEGPFFLIGILKVIENIKSNMRLTVFSPYMLYLIDEPKVITPKHRFKIEEVIKLNHLKSSHCNFSFKSVNPKKALKTSDFVKY